MTTETETDLARARAISARYLLLRAFCEEKRGRPHVAKSERYVASLVALGECDDGQTMRRAKEKWA